MKEACLKNSTEFFCLDAENAELEEGQEDGKGGAMPCFESPS